MLASFKTIARNLSQGFKRMGRSIRTRIGNHPFLTLFIVLGVLLVLIIISNIIQRPPQEEQAPAPPAKSVEVYRIGEAPRISVQAQVEKSGVVTITALSPGVVQELYAEPGTVVKKGQTLLSTATNYQGGNALSLQRSIAARQLQNVNETYDTQKELIQKQRDLANKTDENSDEMREITQKSLDETKDLINVNDEILKIIQEIDDNTSDDYEGLTAPSNSRLSVLQLRSQFLSVNNQLRSALRNAEYSSSDEEPPAELSNIQRDIAIKQLDIQEKAIDLNRDISRLQFQVAQVQEATMFPAAPFNATVQRVNVKIGQAVQPGTPLMVLSQVIEEDHIVAIAYVPREVARKISYMEPSRLSLGSFIYEAYPSYITQDAIQGTLYGVYYPIPDMYHQQVTDTGYINIEMPVGMFDTGIAAPYIPIDSVYQTEEASYVFVVKNNEAENRQVKLGPVMGRFVEVESGIEKGDVIILDRTIVAGDKVQLINE